MIFWYTGMPKKSHKKTTEKNYLERNTYSDAAPLYSQIVEHIRKWIRSGKFKEGDRLPSERELAQMFDVSRVPIREALKILEFLGIVHHVRGKGVLIRKMQITKVLSNLEFPGMEINHVLRDLYESRRIFEVEATRLAAVRRTQTDIEKMERAMLEMDLCIQSGKTSYDASVQFHNAVIGASHNVILIRINEFLSELLYYSRSRTLQTMENQKQAQNFHKIIVDKIKKSDVDGAAEAQRNHMKSASEILEESFENKP
jgi:GntR family transcriptional repressor for pyruvate dehydrogenase complex